MSKNFGVLLLVLAGTLAEPYVMEFCEWFKRRYRIMKRCQYRREAVKTNLSLYKRTGEDYYIERVKELGK